MLNSSSDTPAVPRVRDLQEPFAASANWPPVSPGTGPPVSCPFMARCCCFYTSTTWTRSRRSAARSSPRATGAADAARRYCLFPPPREEFRTSRLRSVRDEKPPSHVRKVQWNKMWRRVLNLSDEQNTNSCILKQPLCLVFTSLFFRRRRDFILCTRLRLFWGCFQIRLLLFLWYNIIGNTSRQLVPAHVCSLNRESSCGLGECEFFYHISIKHDVFRPFAVALQL